MRIFVSICAVVLDCFLCSALYAGVLGYYFPHDSGTASALAIAGMACSVIVLCAMFPSRIWRNNSDLGAFLNALLAPFAGTLLTAAGMVVLAMTNVPAIGQAAPATLIDAAGALAIIGTCGVCGIAITASKFG